MHQKCNHNNKRNNNQSKRRRSSFKSLQAAPRTLRNSRVSTKRVKVPIEAEVAVVVVAASAVVVAVKAEAKPIEVVVAVAVATDHKLLNQLELTVSKAVRTSHAVVVTEVAVAQDTKAKPVRKLTQWTVRTVPARLTAVKRRVATVRVTGARPTRRSRLLKRRELLVMLREPRRRLPVKPREPRRKLRKTKRKKLRKLASPLTITWLPRTPSPPVSLNQSKLEKSKRWTPRTSRILTTSTTRSQPPRSTPRPTPVPSLPSKVVTCSVSVLLQIKVKSSKPEVAREVAVVVNNVTVTKPQDKEAVVVAVVERLSLTTMNSQLFE